MYDPDDTIAAIASAAGPAARGIVRLSGPRVVAILESCFRPSAVELCRLRAPTVVSGKLCIKASSELDVEAAVYLWPGTRSYTRQPLAELHTIGSPPLVQAALHTLCAAGARLAEPGEFTLRAFLAGRIDLTQAEAVLGVVDARAESELRTALEQLAGGLAQPLAAIRENLLNLLAELEAGLDFTEEDIHFVSRQEIEHALVEACTAVAALQSQLGGRHRHDWAPRAVLVGWPNVGKSSLFNALVQETKAIVSAEPGTTRDYLTATIDFGTARCQLLDTAGIMPSGTDGPLDTAAQRAASEAASGCEIRLLCLDASRPLNDWERDALTIGPAAAQLVVLTKCDRPRRAELTCEAWPTSAARGLGLEALGQAIARKLHDLDSRGGAVAVTVERSADSVQVAGEGLSRALELARSGAGEELVAGELRLALAELGRVAGAVYSEDVLERIFNRFCIGK